MPRNYIDINPDILSWARERARYSPKSLAKKINTTHEKYKQFEEGTAKPTLKQFYLLVKGLNRPAQFFFGKNPPDEPDILREMRRLPGSETGKESPELAGGISLVTDYREMILQLLNALDVTIQRLDIKANLNSNPDRVAEQIRESIGVSIETQSSWRDDYEALRSWRTALEGVGVLVFQVPSVSLKEMRGFSIPHEIFPIIGINPKDRPKPRIFTIFHELAHIIIGERMLDATDRQLWELNSNLEVEIFCNRISASVLIPRDDLLNRVALLHKTKLSEWEDEEVGYLSNRYKVSREVVVRRLTNFDAISEDSYNKLLKKYRETPPPPSGDGGNPYQTRISRVGTLLTTLAFRGYYENLLTESDLSSLFNLQIKNLGAVEELALGTNYRFGE